jgi:hypothetical protein
MTKKLVDETVEQFLLRGEKEERFLITDVATHGCSGGTISELIYYNDTVQFYDDHEDEIWDELSNMADDLGETIPFMISNFRGCKNVSDPKTFKNLLRGGSVNISQRKYRTIEKMDLDQWTLSTKSTI